MIRKILMILMITAFILSRGIFSVIRYLDFYEDSMRAMIFFVCSNTIYVLALIFLASLIYDKINKKDYWYLFIIVVIHLLTRSEIITHLLLMVFFARYINNKNIILYTYVIVQSLILIFALLNKSNGINPGGLGREGVYLGFTNINVSAAHIYSLLLGVLFIFRKNIMLPLVSLVVVSIVILFSEYTGSRTIMYASMPLLCLLVPKSIYQKYFYIFDYSKYLIIPVVTVFLLFSVYISYTFYDTDLNALTSSRLLLFKQYIDSIDNYIFGMETLFTKAYYQSPLDNGYIHIFYQSGIIGIFIITFLVGMLIKIMYDKKEYVYIVITMSFMVFNLTEKIWDTNFNFVVIMAMFLVGYSKDKKVEVQHEK